VREPARDRLRSDQQATTRRLAALEREHSGIVESAGQSNGDDEHDPEGATIAFERQHLIALISQAREHLAEIEAALRRLDDGSYGSCSRCGRPIGAPRLEARPSAATCIGCASARR
jgi:RNA polymerase-binding protein DksA